METQTKQMEAEIREEERQAMAEREYIRKYQEDE
jgi:hypothetical protein